MLAFQERKYKKILWAIFAHSIFLWKNYSTNLEAGQAGVDIAEDVTDDRAKNHQSRNNNDSYQNKNQRILNKTLAFFFGWKQHFEISPFL